MVERTEALPSATLAEGAASRVATLHLRMETATSDEQMVERALAGDAEAFGEIVRRWERRIFALAYGMLGREEDARDATQETFLAAFRNLRGFRGEAEVSSWLHRIAVNQCITRQRRAKVRSESALEEEQEKDAGSFAAPLGLSPVRITESKEISDILNVPLSTVKSRLYTALKQLQMKLQRFGSGPI